MSCIVNYIIEQQIRIENDLLMKVAKDVLGREPLPEDGKEFVMLKRSGECNKYYIQYKGTVIGSVTRTIEEYNFTMTFNPNDTKCQHLAKN